MNYEEKIEKLIAGESTETLTIAESSLLPFNTLVDIGNKACAKLIEGNPELKMNAGLLADQIESSTGIDFTTAALVALASTGS